MMINFLIREATPADAVRLAELRYEFRSGLRPTREDRQAFLQRCAAWMHSRLSGEEWKCWVAARQAAIVGQIWLHTIEKLPNPGGEAERHGYITNVYVQPQCRGGLGGQLLRQALDWARQQRLDAVILWPTTRSRSLYLRHGFRTPPDLLQLRAGKTATEP